VRFNHFARLVPAIAAVSVLAILAGNSPAAALSAAPRTAPEFNGSVSAIAFRGSIVYVGGSFTQAVSGNRTYPRQRLAAFDARTGALLSWAPAADGTVRSLAVSGSAIYAAGDFHKISGVRRDAIARLDATSGALGSFSHDVAGTAYAVAAGNGRLYLGGRFNAVDGGKRSNLAAFSLATGALDSAWRPTTDDAVHALSPYGTKIFLGGVFESHVAAISATGSGALDPSFHPKVAAEVNGLSADATGVYVATGGQGGQAIALSPTGATRWLRVFDGDTAAITSGGGVTYIGGHFDRACLTPRNGSQGKCSDGSVPRVKLAAVSSSTGALTNWMPAANGVVGVRALAVGPTGGLSAGGDFTQLNGQTRRRFAYFP
jgi:hypothetical protein